MSDWVGGFIAVALTQAAGAGWLALLTPRRRSRSERWALAWVLGTLFSTCVVWCVGVSGLPWHPLALAFPHVAVAAWGATRARRRPLQPEPVPARSMKPAQMASSTGDGSARVRLALKLALGLVVLLVAAHTLREGARFADSHAVWALRAKVVAIDGGFDGSYWQDWHDSHDRRAYPPLLSLSGAWVLSWGGALDAAPSKLVNLGFYLALLGLVHAALARRLSATAALAATLVFALSRPLVLAAGWGVADLPLAVALLAAVSEFGRGRRGSTELAALCLAAAVACKFEGLWIAASVWLLAASLRPKGTPLSQLVQTALPAALIGLAWFAQMTQLGVPFEFGPRAELAPDLAHVWPRLELALGTLASALLQPQWFFVAPIALLLALRRGGARRPRLDRLGTRVVLALLLFVVLLYGFQAGDTRALLATTLERLLLQLFPLGYVLTLSAAARRRNSASHSAN